MRDGTRLLNARSVRALDVGVVIWIVVWIALGALIWHDIKAQSSLSANVIKVGTAVKDTGDAFAVLGAIPLVGGGIGDFADRISRIGAEVQSSGQASRDSIERVAVVAGIGVGILPAALVLLLYLPLRLAWRRDVRSLTLALPAQAGDPGFEQYLARRAIDALSWEQLRALTGDPWRDIGQGDYRILADAELKRVGVTRPAGS